MDTVKQVVLVPQEGYEPGHIEPYYGNGLTTLMTLQPAGEPVAGDLKVELTVNGEWRFEINRADGQDSEITGDYWKTDDITPEVEGALSGSLVTKVVATAQTEDGALCDGDSFMYDGAEHRIEYRNNNWFEYFVFEYNPKDGLWHEVGFETLDFDKGPTEDEAFGTLASVLADEYEQMGIKVDVQRVQVEPPKVSSKIKL